MAETKKDKQFFSIGWIFFLLIVIPLSLMAFLIANGIYDRLPEPQYAAPRLLNMDAFLVETIFKGCLESCMTFS